MSDPSPRPLPILYPGSCEPLKAAIHGVALGLAALMGAYNAAAWWHRRQSHLAVNTFIYLAAVFFEQRHVVHHLLPCRPPHLEVAEPAANPAPPEQRAA